MAEVVESWTASSPSDCPRTFLPTYLGCGLVQAHGMCFGSTFTNGSTSQVSLPCWLTGYLEKGGLGPGACR